MSDEAFDEYLWDRSGEPDEELRSLESLLARYRFNRPLPPMFDELAARDGEPEM